MSNRRQFSFEVGQMGKVWVASISLFGISAIGATERDALEAVFDALKTHGSAISNQVEDCESCQ